GCRTRSPGPPPTPPARRTRAVWRRQRSGCFLASPPTRVLPQRHRVQGRQRGGHGSEQNREVNVPDRYTSSFPWTEENCAITRTSSSRRLRAGACRSRAHSLCSTDRCPDATSGNQRSVTQFLDPPVRQIVPAHLTTGAEQALAEGRTRHALAHFATRDPLVHV